MEYKPRIIYSAKQTVYTLATCTCRLTTPISTCLVNMTIMFAFSCQTMAQNSFTVCGWGAVNYIELNR